MPQGDIDTALSYGDFKRELVGQGFTNGRRGTFWTPDRSRFLYQKSCHRVPTAQQARETLALLRHVTVLGVLYPGTQWGNYADEDGSFQLFAITPGLTVCSRGEPEAVPGRQAIKRIPSKLEGIFDEDSHILDWYRRLDPDFDANTAPEPNSLVWLLNPFEASHADNWGWDENGKLFPVDVEVVDIANTPDKLNIVHNWYSQQQLGTGYEE